VDGTITTLADSHNGGRLNSPNDVVVRSDGSIWFTDPPYGILTDYEGHKAESEQERNNVFRLEPESGTLEVVIDDMDRPNGLAFSPDESVLYVSDTGHSDAPEGPPNMRAYDVDPAGRATGGRLFAPMRGHISDGFRLDTSGNIWTSAGHGVHCYTPDATLLVRIAVPERVANVAFGGPKRNRLFIAGHTSLYSIILGVNGSLWP
jgi:gluconolactonase